MRRRLLKTICIAGFFPSLVVAQSRAKVWRIAFLEVGPAESWRRTLDGFKKAFAEFGYKDGVNYVIEAHHAREEAELPSLAQKAVTSRPDAMLTWASVAAHAAKQATNRIPIVFMASGDPVGMGLVESLSRPSGNVTGVSVLLDEMASKQFDLLHEAFPHATHVAVLMTPAYASHRIALASIQGRARRMAVKVLVVEAASQQEIDRGFELIAHEKAQAVLVLASPFISDKNVNVQIVTLAQRAKIPCVGGGGGGGRGFVLTYWASFDEMYQRGAELVHKILQGAKPADLPVVQCTRFDLTVDLKAARAIGVEIPQSVLFRADQVVE